MKVEAVKVLQRNNGQSIELPKDFSIDDDKVYLKKTGNIITIIPYHNPWQNLHQSLPMFSDDFMTNRNQPSQERREDFE